MLNNKEFFDKYQFTSKENGTIDELNTGSWFKEVESNLQQGKYYKKIYFLF